MKPLIRDEVIAMHEAGASLRAIAQHYGTYHRTIARAFQRWGYVYRGHHEALRLAMQDLTPEQRRDRTKAARQKLARIRARTP